MRLLELFHEITLRPQSAKEIKDLILQLAFQGKLTANWRASNQEVEPASILLKRIQEEKAQLIKEKKIKKEKELSPVNVVKMNHNLPKDWIWCRMQDYLDVRDGTHDSPKYVDHGYPLVTSKNLYSKKLDLTDVKYISETDYFDIIKRSFIEKGDILFAMIGTIGNPVLVDTEPNFAIKNVALIKYYSKKDTVPGYVLHFLEHSTREFKNHADGAVQSFVSLSKIRNKEFPLPPLEEQKAIVAIVESLFQEIEKMEQLTKARIEQGEDFVSAALRELTAGDTPQAWSALQPHFQRFFKTEQSIKKLRESILQLAVQGKLTVNWRAANPSVEPASELLKRIQAEKAQLIKEKKIKKEDPLPPIKEDEKPFELPDGWEWCRLGDVSKQITDGEHQTPPRIESGRVLLSAKNIRDGFIDYDNCEYISEEHFQKSIKRCKAEPGDLLIVSVGGTIGRVSMVEKDIPFALVRSVAMVKNLSFVPDYLRWVMNSPLLQETVESKKRGGAQPCLYLGEIKSFLFPVAPLDEQKAIVEKVNQLMTFCDELEAQIKQNQTYAEQLMQSVVREVVEG